MDSSPFGDVFGIQLDDDVTFLLLIFSVAIAGIFLFLIDGNPGNAGYVVSHFVFPEDIPLEIYELLYSPIVDTALTYLTFGGWIWTPRSNLKLASAEKSGEAESKARNRWKKKGQKGPVQAPAQESPAKEILPRDQCEFTKFPPEEIETTLWFKFRVIWGYLKIALCAIVKENLWFMQYLLKLEPGYSFFSRSKKTGLEALYIEHAYRSYEDCWNRPICSAPEASVDVVIRERKNQPMFAPYKPLEMSERKVRCTNLASYNYLGFGGIDAYCTPKVSKCLEETGLSTGSMRGTGCGTHKVHKKLERTVADFLEKEDAFVVGMGFATNSTIIPAIIDPQGQGKGCLILSDALNHKSIVEGVRLSSVTVKPFNHNDMVDLERKLRHAVDFGQPSGQPWRKIVVVVEGIYSMEGDFCRLREIVALKEKYGAQVYLDEAHSIGAVGCSGRGVTELLGIPRSKVDIMMGTFTKSFGSAGGYISGPKDVIRSLRKHSSHATFAPAMSPACASQALAAFQLIIEDSRGKEKIEALRRNSNFFRKRLRDMGMWVLGDEDSPVVPVLMDQEAMWYFSVHGLKVGLAIVVVCAPATPYLLPRSRFCVSAAHTIEQLTESLNLIEKLGNQLGILFRKNNPVQSDMEYYKWLRNAPLEVKRHPGRRNFEPLAAVSQQDYTEPAAVEMSEIRETNAWPFSIFDPLAIIQKPPANVVQKCKSYLSSHGFGTCGPRGFYGTTMEHLELENVLAKALKTETAVFYAHGVSVASSVLASPMLGAKDLVFCFTKCHYGVKCGLRLNGKCTLIFVDDMRDLQKWIHEFQKIERIDKEKVGYRSGDSDDKAVLTSLPERFTSMSREIVPWEEYGKRYVVTEGMFQCDGTIVNLPKLLTLRKSANLTLVLDETLALGAVGPRGICDYYSIQDISQIDVWLGSFEFALGSIGGFCAGPHHCTRDLRLTSSGYCFSASAPGVSCLWSTELVKAVVSSAQSHKGFKRSGRNSSSSSISTTAESEDGNSSRPVGKKSAAFEKSDSSSSSMDEEETTRTDPDLCTHENILHVADRWRRFNRNVEYVHTAVKEKLCSKYHVTGDHYVIHLVPRLGDALLTSGWITDEVSSCGSDSDEKMHSGRSTRVSFTDPMTLKNREFHEESKRYMEAIKKEVPKIDFYTRPSVEKAVDSRLGIECDDNMSLRFAVNAMHSKADIDELVDSVLGAANW